MALMNRFCPVRSQGNMIVEGEENSFKRNSVPCSDDCAWFCHGDKMCSVQMIAIELLKRNERG